MDKGNYTGMLILNLQKTLDTVDHNILLGKLKALGFDKNSVPLFGSYLGTSHFQQGWGGGGLVFQLGLR